LIEPEPAPLNWLLIFQPFSSGHSPKFIYIEVQWVVLQVDLVVWDSYDTSISLAHPLEAA
jgi:hypothetical protein